MYVCLCKQLTEADVVAVGQEGNWTPQALIEALGLRDERCCGRCARNVDELLPLVAGPACV